MASFNRLYILTLEQSLCFWSLYDLSLLPGFHRLLWQNARDKVFERGNEMAGVNPAVRVILHLRTATLHVGQEQINKKPYVQTAAKARRLRSILQSSDTQAYR